MQNDKNLCIKYLMNELEPSEIMALQKAIEEDQDLLIELESLRNTLQKLETLDEVEPPENIRESVIQQAVEYRAMENWYINQFSIRKMAGYLAAAAALIFTVGLSGTFITDSVFQSTYMEYLQPTQQNTSEFQQSAIQHNTSSVGVKPWVDRNDILRFEDKFNSDRATAFDSALNKSFQKLVPVNNEFEDITSTGNRQNNGFQLTSSNK